MESSYGGPGYCGVGNGGLSLLLVPFSWEHLVSTSFALRTHATLMMNQLEAAAVGIIRAYTMAPPGITVFDNPTLSTWAIAFISSTLTTNLWATSLVAYRTWYVSCLLKFFSEFTSVSRSHNKFIRSITGETLMTRFRRQNGILAILIESGVFYACTWVCVLFCSKFRSQFK